LTQVTKQGFLSEEKFLTIGELRHRLLLPLVKSTAKEAQKARVVVVSSVAHLRSAGSIRLDDLNYKKESKTWNAYAQSKVI
jgi:NAD(P)-dependent dehydrogenase (short-subunit alcohol dehydrogenase family)